MPFDMFIITDILQIHCLPIEQIAGKIFCSYKKLKYFNRG